MVVHDKEASAVSAISQNKPVTSVKAAGADTRDLFRRDIWVVTGPAGCGKTTVTESLAASLSLPYIEGDSFHTKENVEKMRGGIPLDDADRWDWLIVLRDESINHLRRGSSGVVTCSTLKRKYRDVIRVATYYDSTIHVHFIFLDAPAELLRQRVEQRAGHFMGAGMVQGQLAILERPTAEERDVVSIDVSGSAGQVQKAALAAAVAILDGSP